MMDFTENPSLNVFKSDLVKCARFSEVYELPLLNEG